MRSQTEACASDKSSSQTILKSIGEHKSAAGSITLEHVKSFIFMKIMILFRNDLSLAQDLQLYVKPLNDFKKLAAISQSLDFTAESIKACNALSLRANKNASLPLVKVFFSFLIKMLACTKDDFEGNHDPELFRIVKAFYTNRVNELDCEYSIARMKISFLCEVLNSGDHELMELFYQLGVNCNLPVELYGNTPLLYLISNARNTEAEYLLTLADKYPQNMLDVNVRSTLYGTNVLHLVVAKGYRERSFHGQSLSVSNLALAEKIIQQHANVNLGIEKKDDIADGMTALHLAAARKDIEFCRLLIKHGADIHIKNAMGQTPLDLLFLSDARAEHLIDGCTGGMSSYRQFQPEDASPEKLKIALETYFAEVSIEQLSCDRISLRCS